MQRFLKLGILLCIISCAPIHVVYDYDKQTNFSNYKTYNYYANLETGLSELDTNRLLDILDEQLQNKGLLLSETPDFFIDITSAEFEAVNRNTVGVGVGGGGRNIGGGVSIGIPIAQNGINRQIVFDFRDENVVGLFWQAVIESSFNQKNTPEKREAKLQTIVTKVLKGFPPKK